MNMYYILQAKKYCFQIKVKLQNNLSLLKEKIQKNKQKQLKREQKENFKNRSKNYQQFILKIFFSSRVRKELLKIKDAEQEINRDRLIYKTVKKEKDQTKIYKTIKSFGTGIYSGIIIPNDKLEEQINLKVQTDNLRECTQAKNPDEKQETLTFEKAKRLLKERQKFLNGFNKLDVDKLDIGKLETTPADLRKLSNVVEKKKKTFKKTM